jgi:hypothetical protein
MEASSEERNCIIQLLFHHHPPIAKWSSSSSFNPITVVRGEGSVLWGGELRHSITTHHHPPTAKWIRSRITVTNLAGEDALNDHMISKR